MEQLHKIKEIFNNPPSKYRSMPFWAWNDKLEPEEMRQQIQSMKENGVGGFFMHSREGLETEYMGTEWMECIRAAVDEAKKNGMYAWLYDEDRWPSGTAGGTVPAESEEYRAKGLTIEISNRPFLPEHSVQALYKARVEGMSIFQCERLDISKTYSEPFDSVFLIFRLEISEKSEWFNNQSPPDNLNPNTIKRFIEKTHERYKEQVGAEFGKTIPGAFTDEPGLHDRTCRFEGNPGWLPWTYIFTEFFKERRGYDVFDTLPYIFFNGEFSYKARHDYWWTITELFSESFTQQLYNWCDKNGLSFTGHFLWENNLGVATRVCGAIMPNYRYQHIPGIDILNNQTDEYITVKQCTSVANQYGRKYVMTETYGCTGWDFDFEGQKWIGDFQFVMGINIRCQHLALYSIRGCRKRDYPPVFNYNTTWWKYNKIIEDYFSRLSAVLTVGDVVRDILIIHPSTTAWSMLGTNPYGLPKRGNDRDIPAIKEYGDQFNLFLKYMMGCHNDFDLGDELIMREAGSIREGKLFVNKKGYKLVIIPSVKTLLESTVNLLSSFLEQGGQVIAIEPLPTMISGDKSESLKNVFSHKNMTIAPKWTEVDDLIKKTDIKNIHIQNEFGQEVPSILYMLRDAGEYWILFMVNNDRKNCYNTNITLHFPGTVQEWMLLDGKTQTPSYCVSDNITQIEASFGPADSRLYVIKKDVDKQSFDNNELSANIQYDRKEFDSFSGTKFPFTRTLPNSLVLDRCRYKMADEAWSEQTDVWVAQHEIRTKLGMNPVHLNDQFPQRYTWINTPHPMDKKHVYFEFEFNVKDMPQGSVDLVIERPEWFNITLNGARQNNSSDNWFIDRSLRRIPLSGVKEGKNILTLHCEYMNYMEIEDCYIVGDFAVDNDREIVHEPDTLSLGDWTLQGYKHYAGSIVYHFGYLYKKNCDKDERILIQLGEFSAVTIEVRINGKTTGFIPWKAASLVDITDDIVEGKNEIELEVMGSPRNFFGPFHEAPMSYTTNSSSFRSQGNKYTADYITKPYGLFEPARIYRCDMNVK